MSGMGSYECCQILSIDHIGTGTQAVQIRTVDDLVTVPQEEAADAEVSSFGVGQHITGAVVANTFDFRIAYEEAGDIATAHIRPYGKPLYLERVRFFLVSLIYRDT